MRAPLCWELQMNEDLEATLARVLRMPEDWQRQAAKAMLPTVYKWETRRATDFMASSRS